jgi:predicted RNA-binding Zn-ribbon protein involved in translation (DUF1610 family)
MKIEHTYFGIMQDTNEGWQLLECQSCGEVFNVDYHTEQNLIYDYENRYVVPKCPMCGQEGDE